MKLIEIFNKIEIKFEIISDRSRVDIDNISLNSNEIGKNDIFIAIRGFKTDGHKFIQSCYDKGVRNFVIEDSSFITREIKENSSIIKTEDDRETLAVVSNILNDFPFDKLKMIGITGTKGKTTVSTLIYKIFSSVGKTNLFSTVKNMVNGKVYESTRTTMEADKLQRYLKSAVDNDYKNNIVEVSSHAVTLKRIYNINWDTAVFTNLSRDHLDLYGSMENYFQAKLDFFRALNDSDKKDKIAVVNIDDPKGLEVCSELSPLVKTATVGQNNEASYRIENSVSREDGIEFDIVNKNVKYKVKSKLRGEFNISNVALAFVCALENGIGYEAIFKVISNIDGIDGRFEIVIEKPFKVIVDYAHSPDSLEKILKEARKISKNRVICVFGCTGDRDKEKRPIMGEISSKKADFTVITNDDTYTEEPLDIAKSIEAGFKNLNKSYDKDYTIILDRREAIKKALLEAKEGDVVIIAGMGHEKYQIIGGKSIPYCDKETVMEEFNRLSK